VRTDSTQSRSAALIASLSVAVPVETERISAPSSRMRTTLRCWRRVSSSPMNTTHSCPSSAATVAVATPCWPAPVSAITLGLPMRLVSNCWPRALLSLCAPVWRRSSRFSQSWTPSSADRRLANVTGVGRPA
jgi:hypothetical protein